MSWLPLDDQPGPAVARTAAQERALAQKIVARAYPQRRWLWAAAAILGTLGLAGGATAAWQRWQEAPPAELPLPPQVSKSKRLTFVLEPPPRVVETPRPKKPKTVAPAVAPPPVDVRDLLAEANQLRKTKQWSAAAQKYRQVVELSDAASARISVAELALNHLQDPAEARAMIAPLLKSHGPLLPRALLLQAQAAAAQKDWPAARDAAQTLLAQHRSTPEARTAERLLESWR